jgi:hypothetical protein
MTLQNLLSIGRLKAHVATALEVRNHALRRKRNANDYTGDVVTPDMVAECVAQAAGLLGMLKKRLKQRHPHLMSA